MSNIDHFYFVIENVLMIPPSRIILNSLRNNNNTVEGDICKKLFDLEEEFLTDHISMDDFLEKMRGFSELDLDFSDFKSRIFEDMNINGKISNIVKELKEIFSVFAISTYPPDFLEEIFIKTNLSQFIRREDIFNVSEICGLDTKTLLFEQSISEKKIIPGKTLWIDSDPKRSSAAIRAGIDTIIFIDSRRLRREIALRGLLPLLGDE